MVEPAVISQQDVVIVLWIDPHFMVIQVEDRCVMLAQMDYLTLISHKGFPAVARVEQIVAQDPDLFRIVRCSGVYSGPTGESQYDTLSVGFIDT